MKVLEGTLITNDFHTVAKDDRSVRRYTEDKERQKMKARNLLVNGYSIEKVHAITNLSLYDIDDLLYGICDYV